MACVAGGLRSSQKIRHAALTIAPGADRFAVVKARTRLVLRRRPLPAPQSGRLVVSGGGGCDLTAARRAMVVVNRHALSTM